MGSIEVICGSMFSGKTEELIRRVKRAQFAGLKPVIFKPRVDTRNEENKVVSHDNSIIPCEMVSQEAGRVKLKLTTIKVLMQLILRMLAKLLTNPIIVM